MSKITEFDETLVNTIVSNRPQNFVVKSTIIPCRKANQDLLLTRHFNSISGAIRIDVSLNNTTKSYFVVLSTYNHWGMYIENEMNSADRFDMHTYDSLEQMMNFMYSQM